MPPLVVIPTTHLYLEHTYPEVIQCVQDPVVPEVGVDAHRGQQFRDVFLRQGVRAVQSCKEKEKRRLKISSRYKGKEVHPEANPGLTNSNGPVYSALVN